MLFILLLLFSHMAIAETHVNSIQAQWLQKQYITQKESRSHSQSYSEFFLSWDYNNKKKKSEKRFDGQVIHALGEQSELYVHMREAFLGYRAAPKNHFYLGKKIESWSRVDKNWALGVWEPSLKTDGYHFSREGLAGAFYKHKFSNIELTLMASPFFTPDQGPAVKVDDGELSSSNRWFKNNIKNVQIGNVNSPLVYKLHKPEVEDIVLQDSYAGRLLFGDSEDGISLQLSYADKPINQLYIGIRPIHPIGVSNKAKLTELHIFPQSHRHRLTTTEINFATPKMNAWVSYNYDNPYAQNLGRNWVTTPFVRESIFAFGVDGAWGRNRLSSSLLKRDSEVALSTSSFQSEELQQLSDRYSFKRATLLRYQRLDGLGKYGTLKFSVQWIHSLIHDADMLSAKWEYNYFKNWSWMFGGDIIGTRDDRKTNFFSQNRSNDRVYGGMSYVF